MNRKLTLNDLIIILIGIVLVMNFFGTLFPILREDDAVLYANIAKHMVQSHNWIDLQSLDNHPWLDKPHFLFWMVALSFSIFGIHSFAYILPGFIFYVLGGVYTYKLTHKLYPNKQVALLASLIYFSNFHSMLCAVDVRAEAYLMGEIMAACYYWYGYDQDLNKNSKNLWLGAIFTACALMTKGLFVLITIFSGLFAMWIYQRRWFKTLFSPKWLLAFLLSLIFTLPEIFSLYNQFDLHPELTVFDHKGVSGVKWFFWDSQFGRFFNDGPIKVVPKNFSHYFYFIHTFLWSFLPWTMIFLVYLFDLIKGKHKLKDTDNQKEHIYATRNQVFLLSSFFTTFVVFSISVFQLDYYICILLPFAAILCANWLVEVKNNQREILWLWGFQVWLSIVLTLLVISLSIFIFGHKWTFVVILVGIIIVITYLAFAHVDGVIKSIVHPVLAIGITFMFLMIIYGRVYAKYDLGYQVAQSLNSNPNIPVVDYKVRSLTLGFYAKGKYTQIMNLQQLRQVPRDYYLLVDANNLSQVMETFKNHVQVKYQYEATTIDKLMKYILVIPKLEKNLDHYVVLYID